MRASGVAASANAATQARPCNLKLPFQIHVFKSKRPKNSSENHFE